MWNSTLLTTIHAAEEFVCFVWCRTFYLCFKAVASRLIISLVLHFIKWQTKKCEINQNNMKQFSVLLVVSWSAKFEFMRIVWKKNFCLLADYFMHEIVWRSQSFSRLSIARWEEIWIVSELYVFVFLLLLLQGKRRILFLNYLTESIINSLVNWHT